MAEFYRVRDKATRHEYSVRPSQFNPDAHALLDKPAVTRGGEPLPPKHYVPLADVKPKAKRTPTKSPASNPEPVVDGHEAGSEKENR